MAAHGLDEVTTASIESPLDSLSADLLAETIEGDDDVLAASEAIDEEDTTPFRKPRGRPPSGRTWDSARGVWAPIGDTFK